MKQFGVSYPKADPRNEVIADLRAQNAKLREEVRRYHDLVWHIKHDIRDFLDVDRPEDGVRSIADRGFRTNNS